MRDRITGMLMCLLFCLPVAAQTVTMPAVNENAAVPRMIRFSGQAKDAGTTVGITFSLHKSQEDQAALWVETQNVQLDASGKYTVLLGSTRKDGIPTELFTSGEAQWLAIRVEGKPEQPRVRLVSVPYAMKAAEAETLAGHSAGEFVTADKLNATVQQQIHEQLITPPGDGPVINTTPTSAGPTTFSGSTTNQIVQVTQSGTGTALNATAKNTALFGTSTATTGTVYGVEGKAASSSGVGVFGYDASATGFTIGVLGQTQSISGTGMQGYATSPTGKTKGLFGAVSSPDGIAAIFQNNGGGKIISAQSGTSHNEVFSVGGSGQVTSSSSGMFQGIGYPVFLGDMQCGGNAEAGIAFAVPNNCTNYSILNYGGDLMFNRATGQTIHFRENNGDEVLISPGGAMSVSGALSSNGFTSTGAVGIGTSTPAASLEVNGTAQVDGDSTIFGNATIWGNTTLGVGSGKTTTLNGTTNFNSVPTFNNGFASSDSAYLIANNGNTAFAISTYSLDYGMVQGLTVDLSANPDSSTGIIVTQGNGTGIGINGFGAGVTAINASAPSTGKAGYFYGTVDVVGTFSNTGTVKMHIDDPMDPANKFLEHAAVVSPDMKNMYDGTVTTNAEGYATVELPRYFEALNRDFRYQLTVIGDFAQAIVSKEIENNRFQIRTSKPNMKVSWMVTGIRQDAWANAHPMAAEVEKPEKLRGYYLYPELMDAPAERDMRWAENPTLMKQFKAEQEKPKLQKPNPQKPAAAKPVSTAELK